MSRNDNLKLVISIINTLYNPYYSCFNSLFAIPKNTTTIENNEL